MRVGACSIQQSLTPEATNLVKQAINLAKRRGHAQVTPLHVASAMLASSTSLLRNACLKSHSHPLQLRALDLCFNVALNRLPTSASSPLLGHPSVLFPSFSNALVAAFKRAQAHQRRGSIENQQQPILALKIEIEQLVISILDDPSVSRVMKEADFSSTHVKLNLEQIVSIELCSATPLQSKEPSSIKPTALGTIVCHPHPSCQFEATSSVSPLDHARNDDIMNVFDTLMNKRSKCTVIVGESISRAEAVARGVMGKFERGNVHGILRYVQLIRLPLSSLMNLPKEEVEQKMMDLRCHVKSCLARGVVLYLGDLKWVAEFWSNSFGDNKKRSNYYCAVEHIIMELRRLISGIGENGRLWLMGIASFQTYMDCKTGHPSLKSLLDIHPLKIPVCSLELSLKIESSSQGKHYRDGFDYSENLDGEAQSIAKMIPNQDSTIITKVATYSKLPSWLQQYKDETNIDDAKNQSYDNIKDLSKKWNIFGTAASPKQSNIISSSPSSSSSISSYDRSHHKIQKNWPLITYEPLLKVPDLLSNPNSSPNSATSSEAIEDMEDMENPSRFKEFNAENLEILTSALEKKVPWKKEIIPDITSTILKCRSKVMKRKSADASKRKEETWMFFSGLDSKSKQRVAKELAKLVFGSADCYASIRLSSNFASTKADSTDVSSKKRTRDDDDDHSGDCNKYLQRFGEELQENPHRVFFMEEIEQADYDSQLGFKKAIENGNVELRSGELVSVEDAIVIFSCESFSSTSRAPSPPSLVKRKVDESNSAKEEEDDGLERRHSSMCMSLDLNISIGEEDDNRTDKHSFAGIGILDAVDKHIVFNVHEL